MRNYRMNRIAFKIECILARIDELSEAYDAELNARKRNRILNQMNHLSERLAVLEAL